MKASMLYNYSRRLLDQTSRLEHLATVVNERANE